jgi:hypothetical protein
MTDFIVRGRVVSAASASVDGLGVRVVDRDIGGVQAVVETRTDAAGNYSASYSPEELRNGRKPHADVQVQVLVGEQVVASSVVRYNAGDDEEIDVLLPTDINLASEFDTLRTAIGRVYDGPLQELRESDGRGDITYLANKTGWDARAVAMSALAASLSVEAATSKADIPAPFYYALLRSGLPPAPDQLHSTDAQSAVRVWKDAIDTGVIPTSLADSISEASKAYIQLATATALDRASVQGASPLRDLLDVSLGDNADQKEAFAALTVQASGPRFWKAVADKLGGDTADRLRVDGKLGLLTLDNATAIRKLRDTVPELGDPAQLARAGFHDAGKWSDLLADSAVPEVIPGDTDDERRANYASAVAAQLRQSYPTATLCSLVENGAAKLTADDETRSKVVKFFDDHQVAFEIGAEPVARFVARNNLGDTVEAATIHQISRLQRVYQITPDDIAMSGLLNSGIGSAREVVAMDLRTFAGRYGDSVGGRQAAEMIYAKSFQVHSAVTNIALAYATARSAPTLGDRSMMLDASPAGSGAPENSGVIAYPTLESLFGSLDYCGCDECRSFLSPAAYLVDLLMFLDVDVAGSANPQETLLARRPDLEHLPLTCENTNTPLPYIDIVNEILEYFVVHNPRRIQPVTTPSLAGYAGHDTDDQLTAAELTAEPHFVDDAAYTALRAETYPPPLPFHQPLEAARRHLSAFHTTLASAMTALRADDAVDRSSPDRYAWRDILAERLGLSRQQYRLLTDRTVSLADLYGYPAATSETDIVADLTSLVRFARRSQVSYEDVADLLQTRFINPDAELIPRLERLGVGFERIKALKDGTISDADFAALLRPGLDPAAYGGAILDWLRADAVYDRITRLIVIKVPADADPCDADALELRYALPDPGADSITPLDLVKLARLIRLRRVLGWTVDEVDRALTGLWPAAQWPIGTGAPAPARLDAGMLAALPRLGVAIDVVSRLNLRAPRDLPSLLSLWSPIDVHGPGSLYSSLFLAAGASPRDPAFEDNGYGDVLTDATVMLVDHGDAIRAAANLTGPEFELLRSALGFDASTPLQIDEVSAIYRRALLARRLRMSVSELLALLHATGIDPFAAPDPPTPGVVSLLDLLGRMRAAGLPPANALRLVWGRNVVGARGLDDQTFAAFLRSMRSVLLAVDGDFAVADDPLGELTRARMGLVYDAETLAAFFGLLDGTTTFATHYVGGDDGLPAAAVDASGGRLGYDDLGRRLVHAGPLHQAERDDIVAVPGVGADLTAALDQLVVDTEDAEAALFDDHPELQALYAGYIASTDTTPIKRTALLAAVLPDLVKRRKRQQALLTTAAAASTDATFAEQLLDERAVLHAAGDITRPALDDFISTEEQGLTARFYFRDTASGAVDAGPTTAETVDYAPGGPSELPAAPGGTPISARWVGWLEAPQTGTYALTVRTDVAATVRLALDGSVVPLDAAAGVWRNDAPITLAAGSLTSVELVVERVASVVSLDWNSVGLANEVVPGRNLYPGDRVDVIRAQLQRFFSATALAAETNVTAPEAAQLASASTIGGQGWLNALPTTGAMSFPASGAMTGPLIQWCEFAAAKTRFGIGDDRLLRVLIDPAATLDDGSSLLASTTGWDGASTSALLGRFGLVESDLSTPTNLRRMADAFDVVAATGDDATTLLAAISNDPTGDAIRTLRGALRARSDSQTWLANVKTINDELRELQRDALVTFVLARLGEDAATQHIDTVDKLFEFFLMDVQMQACTQTSRIRHALSSVQLFVDRCLLALEPGIQPSAINAKRWSWMKRYRVWEANRKVFLWPENWLEPELRDDASPIFKDVMGELLQGDITDDAAATALGNYLSRLEELARLEPCGIFVEENSPGLLDDIVHVIARTHGAHRKYFYRRRDHGSWVPWQQLKLDIEDDPIVPCVWQGRLFAFWIRLLKQSQSGASIPGSGDGTALTSLTRKDVGGVTPKVTYQAALCYSEYVNGSWQPAKTSDAEKPTTLITCTPAQFDRSKLRLVTRGGADNGLDVAISGDGFSSSFHLYNTHSSPVAAEDLPLGDSFIILLPPASRDLATSTSDLVAKYYPGGPLFIVGNQPLTRDVLTTPYIDRTVAPAQDLSSPWDAPFLYSDARHAFYVTTTEEEVSIPVFDGYGHVGTTGMLANKIPPVLVDIEGIEIPDPIGPVERHNPYVIDVAATTRVISEDAYIHTGIANAEAVAYDGQVIGPRGAVAVAAGEQG